MHEYSILLFNKSTYLFTRTSLIVCEAYYRIKTEILLAVSSGIVLTNDFQVSWSLWVSFFLISNKNIIFCIAMNLWM